MRFGINMSTTFGINTATGIEEIAFRSNYITWTNPIAHLLDDNIKVIPIDNSAQGIETIGDIRKEINSQ